MPCIEHDLTTVVVSRGLLDVLPDEAFLGMILAHELSHILLGHPSDTKFAFYDRMFLPDRQWLQRMKSKRSSTDEQAADTKALELLRNFPNEETPSTGLFLKALLDRAPDLLNLISAHLGNSLATSHNIRMSELACGAKIRRAQIRSGRRTAFGWANQVGSLER